MEGGGGRRGVKIDFLTMSLCKKNVRRMMRVSKWPDQRCNPDYARDQQPMLTGVTGRAWLESAFSDSQQLSPQELRAVPGPLYLAPTVFTMSVYQKLVHPFLNLLMLSVSTASCSNDFCYLMMYHLYSVYSCVKMQVPLFLFSLLSDHFLGRRSCIV